MVLCNKAMKEFDKIDDYVVGMCRCTGGVSVTVATIDNVNEK